MVNYRLAKVEDATQIDALCKREGLATPCSGTIYVAEDNGKVVGFISFAPVHLVDCFVSDSAIASNVLYEKMASVLEAVGAKRIVMVSQSIDAEDFAEKKGFHKTNEAVNIFEKEG